MQMEHWVSSNLKKKVCEAFVGTFLPELNLYFLDSFCIGNFNF